MPAMLKPLAAGVAALLVGALALAVVLLATTPRNTAAVQPRRVTTIDIPGPIPIAKYERAPDPAPVTDAPEPESIVVGDRLWLRCDRFACFDGQEPALAARPPLTPDLFEMAHMVGDLTRATSADVPQIAPGSRRTAFANASDVRLAKRKRPLVRTAGGPRWPTYVVRAKTDAPDWRVLAFLGH
jgi:hypothetical protein